MTAAKLPSSAGMLFRKDPDWVKARDASEKNGKIVDKAVGVYLEPVDFSPMK